MADLVGKDSHTQLQVEVVRNLFLCRGSIIPRAYSEEKDQDLEAAGGSRGSK